MVDPVVNKGKVTVSTGYNSTATSIVLATGQGAELPDPVVDGAYNLPWWDSTNYNDPADDPNFEIVRVTGPAGTGDTKTIVRAQESTAATNKNNADATYKMHLGVTAKTITDLIAVEKCATVIVGKSGQVDYLTTDYGSDDACLQAAMNYVSGLGGGSVLIREGTYTLTATPLIESSMLLSGIGTKTILKTTSAVNALQISSKSDVYLKNFTIDGNSICVRGVYSQNSSNVFIDNVNISDVTGHCVSITGSDVVHISNCKMTDSDDEIVSISNSSNIIISNCYIDTASSGCILVYDYSYNIKIIENTLMNGSISGIRLQAVSDIQISNNTIKECLKGISITLSSTDLWWAENILINGNDIIKNTEYGISTSPAGNNQVRNITILGNQIYRNLKEGIYIIGKYHSIEGNIIADNGQLVVDTYQGITLSACEYITCNDNIIINRDQERTSLLSVDPSLPTSDITVANGKLFMIDQWVTISDDTPFTENNQIDSISGDVITMKTTLANAYTQAENAVLTVRATQKRGIRASGGSDYNLISNNVFKDNVSVPLLADGSNDVIINNIGYNPVGNFAAPAIPATTVNYTNVYGYPCQVQVYGGTVTEIDIDDITTGLTSGIFMIPPGGTINITYSAAPSWRWWGL